MNIFRRTLAGVLAALFLTCWNAPCFAADSAFKEIFEDALYGGLTGTLVGAAILAFTHKPGDHLDYLAYGAATGVFAGVTYGVVKTGKALAEVDHGKVKFAMPTIMPDFPDDSVRGKKPLVITAELIRGKF
ncbi:MAG: hypothetical protein FD174_2842 [Geobacteraceae bacterium]|nr:MAG: hypothetical protein FD174_2842 [Geobacteraceae bacterium]